MLKIFVVDNGEQLLVRQEARMALAAAIDAQKRNGYPLGRVSRESDCRSAL